MRNVMGGAEFCMHIEAQRISGLHCVFHTTEDRNE